MANILIVYTNLIVIQQIINNRAPNITFILFHLLFPLSILMLLFMQRKYCHSMRFRLVLGLVTFSLGVLYFMFCGEHIAAVSASANLSVFRHFAFLSQFACVGYNFTMEMEFFKHLCTNVHFSVTVYHLHKR